MLNSDIYLFLIKKKSKLNKTKSMFNLELV